MKGVWDGGSTVGENLEVRAWIQVVTIWIPENKQTRTWVQGAFLEGDSRKQNENVEKADQ